MMKKVINIFLVLSLILLTFSPLTNVNAATKTLRDYKNQLAKLESEKSENNRLTKENMAAIDRKRNAIVNANNTISSNEKKVEDAKSKVADGQEKIKIKTQELKDIINILQYSDGNSDDIYLSYVFDSESIAELMERQAIIEQIVDYTQKQLDDLDKLIKENKELQVKLAEDNVNLANSITSYEQQVKELEAYIDKLASIGLDYDEQIAAQKNQIKLFEQAGCKDGDDVDDCYYNKGGGSASFSRPLNSGRVTQGWGSHPAIDIGGNKAGTNVYAPANGTVIHTTYHSSCGGNQIFIHHTVGGVAYTTQFAHLKQVNVKPGQKVTKGQVIGQVGGDSSTWYYDKCTTGPHLHYAIAYGYYLGSGKNGYTSWSKFTSNTKATSIQKISGIKNTYGWKWTTRG